MSELWPFKDWYEMTTFWRVIGPGKCLPYMPTEGVMSKKLGFLDLALSTDIIVR